VHSSSSVFSPSASGAGTSLDPEKSIRWANLVRLSDIDSGLRERLKHNKK